MRISNLINILTIAVLPVGVAWDEDARCLRRRRKLQTATNQTDPRLLEDGLTMEDIRPRIQSHNGSSPSLKFHDRSAPALESQLLRGSRRRHLKEITTFQLKMYWEEGYCWQDEWRERKWCLECQGNTCGVDDYLWIMYCDKDEKEQRFIYRPISGTQGGHLSPYSRQDLCWERTRVNAHQLRPCSSSSKQIIIGIKFDGRFEMHPNGRTDDCLEQHHDPKSKEIIRANNCYEARKDHTNFWIMINKKKGDDKGGDDDDDEQPGSDTINDLGAEYCDSHLCKKCQGDCDNDDQCAGKLKCFQRRGNEKVPGCKGGTSSSTRGRDFCYSPEDKGDDNDDQPPGTSTISDFGAEYCDSHLCKKCQEGDCDNDDQCAGKLKCFQRRGNEKVPGCKGGTRSSTRGKDFCYSPEDDKGDDDDQPPGSSTINDLGAEYCDSHLCKKCQGDCDNDDQCAGKLKCFQRRGNEKVPGCKGGTSSSTRGRDFCYDEDDKDDRDDDPLKGSNKIKYLGQEYCDFNTCLKCEGDCDNDSSCAGSLKCFQRSGNEPVPGCEGGEGSDTRGKDFCYEG